jgi:hypothetical protein
LAGNDERKKAKEIWDERSNRDQAVGAGSDEDHPEIKIAHLLLPLKTSIHRDEGIETAQPPTGGRRLSCQRAQLPES